MTIAPHLKPCPFCGNQAELREVIILGGTNYACWCLNCGAQSEPDAFPSQATQNWQHRKEAAQYDKVVEALTNYQIILGAKDYIRSGAKNKEAAEGVCKVIDRLHQEAEAILNSLNPLGGGE